MSAERLSAAVVALHEVMGRLRRECPWDREQTPESLRRYLIEECHEVLEALDAGDRAALKGELGDLLFQVWFHAEVASEAEDGFDLADVLEAVRAKLVRRHPHVFSDQTITDRKELETRWEASKMAEGRHSRLEGVPPLLPALQQAARYQEKAARVGFDWPSSEGVLDKLVEELRELDVAREGEGAARVMEEAGDVLFTLVNLFRHWGVSAEDALRMANRRFKARFQAMEGFAEGEGGLEGLDAPALEALWVRAKRAE